MKSKRFVPFTSPHGLSVPALLSHLITRVLVRRPVRRAIERRHDLARFSDTSQLDLGSILVRVAGRAQAAGKWSATSTSMSDANGQVVTAFEIRVSDKPVNIAVVEVVNHSLSGLSFRFTRVREKILILKL